MENLDPLQIWLLMAAVAYVAFMTGRATAGRDDKESREAQALRRQESAERVFSEMSASTREEVDRLLRDGKIINAVKVIREHSGLSLRDAKLAVDWRRRMMGEIQQ